MDPFNLVKYSAYLFKLSHSENIDQIFIKDEHFSFDEKINSATDNEYNLIFQNFTHSQNFTIGIVSADLHHHAITTFIEDIFINLYK